MPAFSCLLRPFSAGLRLTGMLGAVAIAGVASGSAADLPAAGVEFFETKIRPVLVNDCYECHAGAKSKGGLRLDSREYLLKGGDSGAAIIPGRPDESLLIQSVRHDDPDLEMPAKAPKLAAAVIEDLAAWVAMGAPDPRDVVDAPGSVMKKPWPELLAERRQWWSFQPVSRPALPTVRDASWSSHPVDHFLLVEMEKRALRPTRDADPRTLIRRLSFALTGLPPTSQEAADFAAAVGSSSYDQRRSTVEAAVDRLLASPHFGERWARHWMDLVRYAETHGSEGDPEIPDAWRYRDYLIRGLNADVPWDRLIREHIAGDLLPDARWNRAEGFNESALGTASLRLNEHGFQPVDTLEEQVRTVDNQIDVVAKAFQGLTVSCARCHDHKFDPVSQKDYFAMYGIFASCRPAQTAVDAPEFLARRDGELSAAKGAVQDALTEEWLFAASGMAARIEAAGGDDPVVRALAGARDDASNPLHAWSRLAEVPAAAFPGEWARLLQETRDAGHSRPGDTSRLMWDFAAGGEEGWFRRGAGLRLGVSHEGDFAVQTSGDAVIEGIEPKGIVTHLLSQKHNGHFTSPRFKIETDRISVRAAGGGGAWVRVIVDNYPLSMNPTFPRAQLKPGAPTWVTLDTAYRKGSWAYLEFATGDDLTKRERSADSDGRSWFAVERVIFHDKDFPRDEALATRALLRTEHAPASRQELAALYQRTLVDAIRAWRMWSCTPEQRAFLDYFVRHDLLPRSLAALPRAGGATAEYRRIEADVPIPRRAPGLVEGTPLDAPLMLRGDHKKLGDVVPRGYMEILGSHPHKTATSGRLQLADDIASPANPLTARVMANRIWLHLFGQGLVPTPDNFGRLGEKPTHPELLDFLAARLVEDGWSAKKMIRLLVTSRTWQLGSEANPETILADAPNQWLARARVRRLEAEAIRDSLLAVSGRLDRTMYGPGLAGTSAPRRSVYLTIRRTKLNPFLDAFDAPRPFTTLGRRDVTNVPAQSLALLNDPFVIDSAKQWAGALRREQPAADAATRVRAMFATAVGRAPLVEELALASSYLQTLGKEHEVPDAQIAGSERVWQDFAQSVFNLKEFIYVR